MDGTGHVELCKGIFGVEVGALCKIVYQRQAFTLLEGSGLATAWSGTRAVRSHIYGSTLRSIVGHVTGGPEVVAVGRGNAGRDGV